MLTGVWLAVRGTPSATRTVAYAALGYPVAATVAAFGYLGIGGRLPYLVQAVAVVVMLTIGGAARALALRAR